MSILDAYKKGELLPEEDTYVLFDERTEENPGKDGDNSRLAEPDWEEKSESNRMLYSVAKPKKKRRIVVLPRELKFTSPSLMRGKDVFAVSRALARAGFRKWGNFTYFYGRGMEKNVRNFQKKYKIKQTGVYDRQTHMKLSPFFDLYGASLMARQKKEMSKTPRDIIVETAILGYNKRETIHYTQGPLRMWGVKNRVKPPRVPPYEDCSSYSTWTYWVAGVPDPNGLGYNGYGYTGTLASHGSVTYNPKPGDLAFYGSFPYGHVVIYIGNGKCISHGSEGGPYLLPVKYRSDFSHYRTYF